MTTETPRISIPHDNGALPHHAFLIEGDPHLVAVAVFRFLEQELGVVLEGNVDVWHGTFDVFGIDDSHALREMQAGRAFQGDRRFFLLGFRSMTSEAQNALLKVFEEPTPGTHFFLMTHTAGTLLPTLRSRVYLVRGGGEHVLGSIDPHSFLHSSPAERLVLIQPLLGNKNEDPDKADAIQLVESLERILHTTLLSGEKMEHALRETARVLKYIHGRAPSMKMLLEHLALSLPTVS